MELWDLLDKDRTPLGITHPRGRQYPMPPHTYHTVVSVFTVDIHNRLLLTLRASTKGMYPGYWEFTGGSGVSGEDSLTSAHRELWEETGLELYEIDDLIGPSYSAVGFSNEINVCVVGKARGAFGKSTSTLEEIEPGWYTKEELRELLKTGRFAARTQAYCYLWSRQ